MAQGLLVPVVGSKAETALSEVSADIPLCSACETYIAPRLLQLLSNP